ncbi:MAG: hypothetical protein ACYDG5_08575 [Dehalococcoidales bacterium]
MVENTDLRKVLKGYSNKWVALSADSTKVMGASDTPKGALSRAHSKGELNPILTRVPQNNSAFIV